MTEREKLENRLDTLLNAAEILIETAINQIDPPGTPDAASARAVQDGCSTLTLRVAQDLVSQARCLPKEEAQVWVPNETGVHATQPGIMTFRPKNAEDPLPFPEGPGVLSHRDGVFSFTPATVRTAPAVERAPCNHENTISFTKQYGSMNRSYFWCTQCGAFGANDNDGVPTSWRSPDGGSRHMYAAAADQQPAAEAHSEPSLKGGVGGANAAAGAVTATNPPDPYENESPRRRYLREKYRIYGATGEWPGRPTMHGVQGAFCNTCEGVCILRLLRLGFKI